jgi:predicted RNA binding protein YcfA (HicA-like mRNA interferase family)
LFQQKWNIPKLYSSLEILKVLQRHGFSFVPQNGSHIKYRKPGSPTLTVIIPADRKQIPSGTFHSILKQAALTKTDFEK